MIDLYIKRIVIHQFTPNDTELILSDQLLTITPRIDEYFRKKLSKVFSDEALVINRVNHHYYLIEKRIKHNGSFANYFSENLLQVQPEQSVKKSIKMVEQAAQKIAENFQQDDFAFQSKMKAAIHKNLEEEQELSPEKLADQLFDNNLTARLTFVDELKESIPEPIQVSDIDHSRQTKKLENQKLSLSNGIQLIVPNNVYEDAESVEFIQNPNGTYSILIKNIEDIQNK